MVPNVSGVAGDVARLESGSDVLGDAESPASGVDNPGALLHVGEGLLAAKGWRG